MGPAALTLFEAGESAPTLELKVNFIRPAYAGPLFAEGRVVRRTRRVVFLEGTLTDEAANVVATATATALVIQPSD